MKKLLILLFIAISSAAPFLVNAQSADNNSRPASNASRSDAGWWDVQSVDTMKYSRDLASEKLGDQSFDETIDFQIKSISELGATHVAIGTPYDSEFLPYLRRWVSSARKYGLKVWFRGNLSGWEGWFGRKAISKSEHTRRTEEFILDNPELFEDGDIFSSCPECENGRLGDPRKTGNVDEYKDFLIDEYTTIQAAFQYIGKDVAANYFSMNGDVAELIMDKATTRALGGILVVDHYVKEPSQLVQDIIRYKNMSGGRVMLGEIGVPIPDIHGNMSESEQAEWLSQTLSQLSSIEGIVGINYWVVSGGSTELMSNGKRRLIANSLEEFFKPSELSIKVSDGIGRNIPGAKIMVGFREFDTSDNGLGTIKRVPGIDTATISAPGYKSYTIELKNPDISGNVILSSERESILLRIIRFLRNLLS